MGRVLWSFVSLVLAVSGIARADVCDLGEQATIAAPGTLGRGELVGSKVYVAGGSAGIVAIDVSDPASPSVASATATDGPVHRLVYEYFRNMLVTAEGAAGVGTHQMTTGGTSEIGTTDFGETIVFVGGVSSSFYAGSEQGTLFTFTFDGDERPEMRGSVDLGGEVLDVVTGFAKVYCALGSGNAVAVVDASDFGDPQLVASFGLGGRVTALARDEDLLYAAVDGVGVEVLQIDDTTLTSVGSFALDDSATALIAWQERLFAVGADLGLVEADISLAPNVLEIASLPLGGAAGMTISGDLLFVGRGASGFTVVDVDPCSGSGSSPVTSVIAASARTQGDQNSFWVTDAAFTNLGIEVAAVEVSYLAKGWDNSSPQHVAFVVAPGQQYLVRDVYQALFGRNKANGALRIVASHRDLKISSRTYDAGGAGGTYGQFIPALGATAAAAPGIPGGLLQLQRDASFRTNIGMVNLNGSEAAVEIHLCDADGNRFGIVSRTLKPYEMFQYNEIYDLVTDEDVESGFAVVTVLTAGGNVLFYASVIDNQSNDPINVPAQLVTSGRPWLP